MTTLPSTFTGSSALCWRLWRSARHGLRQLFIEQPIRGISMLAVLLLVWLGIAALAQGVLLFLSREEFLPLKPRLVQSLLGVFFFALFWLISFSGAIITWGALLRNRSAQFHAHLPLNERSLYWGASIEGGVFSGWAALVLSVPLLLVLAQEARDPLLFLIAGGSSVLAFLILCLSVASLAAMVLARLVLVLRRHLVIVAVIAAALIAGLSTFGLLNLGQVRPNAGFLRQTIGALSFTESPFLPPAWAQQAVDAALRGHWQQWLWFSGLLLSSAATIALLAEHIAHRRLRHLLNDLAGRAAGREPRRKGGRTATADWPRWRLVPDDIALLVAKDLRLFRRDPAQVLQFALYFGLLGLYILLLPRFDQSFQFDDRWRPVVSLLNLTAVAMALATFTGRFVFPLIGQEGKRLWVLTLSPWPRSRIVTAKFCFALTIGLPVSVLLVVLSGWLLGLPLRMIAYQGLVTAGIATGCAASALGLGTLLADYREDDAGKVAAGYGGTINLLASMIFIALLLVGAGIPIFSVLRWRFELGLAWVVVITSLWTVMSLRLAQRRFAAAT